MLPNVNWFLPYKEEVTGSNPVAPTRVFQKSLHIKKDIKFKRQ
uniref:MedDCM-OCT-S43-C48-cds26 n=1 Tax=Candidatus Actinomarina minuta TaxID=1389454 RepID=S5DSD4_9ACTN|nr:MedDCM-OCT-S43-C48-cds26 [Candidatus Actinomarina minuta]